jgi:hypothetical protein
MHFVVGRGDAGRWLGMTMTWCDNNIMLDIVVIMAGEGRSWGGRERSQLLAVTVQ